MFLWHIFLFQDQKSSSETREYKKNIYVSIAEGSIDDEGIVKSFKDSCFIKQNEN